MAKNRFVHLFLASAVWLSLGGTMAYAQTLYNKTVTLSIKKAKLGKILKSIQEKSAIQIVYNGQLVDQVAAQTVVANNEKLTDLLNRLLRGTGLEYVVEKNVIVIRAKRQDEQISTSVNGVTFTVKSETFVNGRVTSDKGVDMAAVTVTNLETGASTFTDYQGKFALNAQAGDRLQISYVGYKAQRQTLKNLNGLQIVMEPQEAMLDEVVLTGYQSIEKKLSTGSIFTLKGKDVAEPNVPNIASMLQGKVPGLSIETISGSPNSVPRMRMRGTSTLMGNANPIWVIDGIVQENPTDVNPDKIMGLDPSWLDMAYRGDFMQGSANLMGNSIMGVNINDIESISFLKDAAATALYGTRAANGVILLTTKKGKVGRTTFNYNTSLGFVQRPSYSQVSLMNSQERVQFSKEMIDAGLLNVSQPFTYGYEGAYWDLINRNISQAEFDSRVSGLANQNTDWFAELFRNSFNQSHALSVSGGVEKTTFRGSLNYSDNKGAAKKDRLRNIGTALALVSQVNKKLNLEFQLQGSLNQGTGYSGIQPLDYALNTSRIIAPDLFYKKRADADNGSVPTFPMLFNIQNEINESGNETKTSMFNGSINLRYNILPGLDFSSLFGGQFSNQLSEQYWTERTFKVAGLRGYDYGSVVPGGDEESMSILPFGGILNSGTSNMYRYSWRNMLTYSKPLFNGRDQMTFNLGQEVNSTRRLGYRQYLWGYLRDRGERFANMPQYSFFNNSIKDNKIENTLSAFATASYAFDRKYIVDISARTDASNRFGQYTNSRFLPIWSASARWNVSDEPWLRNNRIINNLNIRGSYGMQGNAVTTVGPDLIVSIPDQEAINLTAREYQLKLKSLAYPDLRWEKTQSSNLGLQIGLLESLVDIDVQAYYKKTKDAITFIGIPQEYSLTPMIINGGTIVNKGFDLNLTLNPIRSKDWNWRIQGTTSRNVNNLKKSAEGQVYTLNDYLNGNVQLPDEQIGTFYVFGFKGLNPTNGMPLFHAIDDVDDPTKLGFNDFLVKAGVKNYTLTGGLNTTLRYRNLSFAANFTFGFGAHHMRNRLFDGKNVQVAPSSDENMQRWLLDRWKKPGDELHTNIPGFVDFTANQRVQVGTGESYISESRYNLYDASDVLLTKADYLKCRGISLAYNLPDSWLKRMRVSSANLGFSVSNIFTIADKAWKGQDPELPGVGSTALPQVPAYNLNVSISF